MKVPVNIKLSPIGNPEKNDQLVIHGGKLKGDLITT